VPTSGITDWPLTAEQIVTQAMYELGALNQGDTPSGEEMEDAILRLNGMLKTWGGEGNLFREVTGTLTLPGGTASGTLPADVRDVSSVRHVVSATNSRQLAEWNRGEFYRLPNRAASGNPTAYYLSTTTAGRAITVWPVPSADITLEVDYSRLAQTVTDPSETIDVLEEWQEARSLCRERARSTRTERFSARLMEAGRFLGHPPTSSSSSLAAAMLIRTTAPIFSPSPSPTAPM
jgi:hypothetical protein